MKEHQIAKYYNGNKSNTAPRTPSDIPRMYYNVKYNWKTQIHQVYKNISETRCFNQLH